MNTSLHLPSVLSSLRRTNLQQFKLILFSGCNLTVSDYIEIYKEEKEILVVDYNYVLLTPPDRNNPTQSCRSLTISSVGGALSVLAGKWEIDLILYAGRGPATFTVFMRIILQIFLTLLHS